MGSVRPKLAGQWWGWTRADASTRNLHKCGLLVPSPAFRRAPAHPTSKGWGPGQGARWTCWGSRQTDACTVLPGSDRVGVKCSGSEGALCVRE